MRPILGWPQPVNQIPGRNGRDERMLGMNYPDAGGRGGRGENLRLETEMLSNAYCYVHPANEAERVYLEFLIREDFERCHPGEMLQDVKRRASFSKEDKGLLRDWMAVAARRAAAAQAKLPSALAA